MTDEAARNRKRKPLHRHHHHHDPHHHDPHHHRHSGDGTIEGDNIIYEGNPTYENHAHTHIAASADHVFEQCLSLLRGIPSDDKRIQILGQLLATLRHQDMLPSLSEVLVSAMRRIDFYNSETPEGRTY